MSKVASDSLVVTVITIGGQAVSFVLFAVIAAVFGANWQTDAFFVALAIPTLFSGAVVNAIMSVFIPAITECRVKRPHELNRLVGATLAYVLLFSFLAMLVVAGASPWLLGRRGIPVETMALASRNALWLMPIIPLQASWAVLAATYNAAGRFQRVAYSAAFRYLVALSVFLAFRRVLGVMSLPLSFVAGAAVQTATVCAGWRSIGLRPVLTWRVEPGLVRSGVLVVPLLIGTAALQFSQLASRVLAAQLTSGSVSMLDYASRYSSAIFELLTSGATLVTLANWSDLAARENVEGVRVDLRQTALTMLFLILPVVAILFAVREPLILLTLQRGKFDLALSSGTAAVLGLLLLGVPMEIVSRFYARVLIVWQRTRTLGWLAGIRMVLMISLAVALMGFWGLLGIALADAVAGGLAGVLIVWSVNRVLGNTLEGVWPSVLKLGISTAGSVVAASGGVTLLSGQAASLQILTAVALGIAAYATLAWMVGCGELHLVTSYLRERVAALRISRASVSEAAVENSR